MKKMIVLSLILCLTSVSLWAQQKPQKWATDLLEQINAIQSRTRTATWTAAINSMCYEKREDLAKQLCGFTPDVRQKGPRPAFKTTPYRAKGYVDLRDAVTFAIARNQAKCGSCWAFAMTACIEYAQVKNGVVTDWPDLSEQQLVSCCTNANGCSGGYIGATGTWAIDNGGLVKEEAYPYVSGTGDVPACNTPSTTKYKISQCTDLGYWIFPASTEDMKKVLDDGYPVDTGMYVYEDFIPYKEGVYQHTTGDQLGGHAVVIVGYDDNHAVPHFIVRNSWWLKDDDGNYVTPWGDNGYFRIKYGDSNFGMQAAWVK